MAIGSGKKYKRGVASISASELQTAVIDPPEWLIPEVLPQGLAILCASSKVGKSWMAMQMYMLCGRLDGRAGGKRSDSVLAEDKDMRHSARSGLGGQISGVAGRGGKSTGGLQ